MIENLKEGQWYWIDYNDGDEATNFVGPAQYLYTEIRGDTSGLIFKSPLCDGLGYMMFYIEDVHHECEPLPSYKDLLDFYRLCEASCTPVQSTSTIPPWGKLSWSGYE